MTLDLETVFKLLERMRRWPAMNGGRRRKAS